MTKIKKTSRFPIFPIRLRPDDRDMFAYIKGCYHLSALSDSMRAAGRVLHVLSLSTEEFRRKLDKYQELYPESLPIAQEKEDTGE